MELLSLMKTPSKAKWFFQRYVSLIVEYFWCKGSICFLSKDMVLIGQQIETIKFLF